MHPLQPRRCRGTDTGRPVLCVRTLFEQINRRHRPRRQQRQARCERDRQDTPTNTEFRLEHGEMLSTRSAVHTANEGLPAIFTVRFSTTVDGRLDKQLSQENSIELVAESTSRTMHYIRPCD